MSNTHGRTVVAPRRRRRARARLAGAIFAAAFLSAVGPADGADLRGVLVDYTVSSWGQKDGLPSSIIRAMAQDTNGYLWLGTDAGPVRFDGARFASWDAVGPSTLPKASVRALCVSRDGSIWFGFGDGAGVSRLQNGELQNYPVRSGVPDGSATVLVEDPDGVIWLGTTGGLAKFAGGRWQPAGDGLPPGPVYAVLTDHHGLLVGTGIGVFQLEEGHSSFQEVDIIGDMVRGITEDRAGTIWVTDQIAGFRRLRQRRAVTGSREEARGSRIMSDSAGNLWVGTGGQGLWRVRFDAADHPIIEKTTALSGLSDDGVTALLEDPDGNLWAATLDGLNRLTRHKTTPIMHLGLANSVETTPDGSVWVGASNAVVEFAHGYASSIDKREPLPDLLSAMHVDERGTLWIATRNGDIFQFTSGRRIKVPLPPHRPPLSVLAITSDRDGGLWIADVDGMLHLNGSRLERLALPADLQHAHIGIIHSDRTGRVWLATTSDRIATIDPRGQVRSYGKADGLDAGTYRVICEDRAGTIWLGGTAGLSRFSNGRFATLHAANAFPLAPLTGIVEDENDGLWLGIEGAGIVRVAKVELENGLADPRNQVHYRMFDKAVGYGTPWWMGHRGMARSKDGSLWFVTGRGVSVIDPREWPKTPLAPAAVRIERIVADDRRVSERSEILLPPRTNRVQIDYTVLNLRSSLKTRFRYRLDGFDTDWVDAGLQRQAFYTNLPPRNYTFRVIASNDDGTWTEPAAVRTLSIQPMFYQTTWFLAACVVGLVATVGATWRLHVRRVRREFALLLGERARLSREIHDTLLQGLFGVALRCEAIAGSLRTSDSWLQDQFLRMRKEIQHYIHEARQSIRDLRSSQLERRDLVGALRASGENAVSGTSMEFELAVTGEPRDCAANVEQQLLRIGQEAILNAVRHAAAHSVRVQVHYDESAITLAVADDGRGFNPERARQGDGHYGLTSMQERAESVGGTFTVAQPAGGGAQVVAVIPLCHS